MRSALIIILFSASNTAFAEDVSLVARGGLLYDNWAKVLDKKSPAAPNPAYPKTGKYSGKDGADYRCKECHGWDYLGSSGAYATGDHATGIAGIRKAAGKEPSAILAILSDRTHGYDKLLGKKDLEDLASFVSKGQVDMDQVIDRKSRKVKGNAENGAKYFNTVCAKCHGADGKLDPKSDPLGPLARKNPWEALHKILNGQPAAEMPALRAFDLQVAADILAHSQTLPD
jgi:cytochrome c5